MKRPTAALFATFTTSGALAVEQTVPNAPSARPSSFTERRHVDGVDHVSLGREQRQRATSADVDAEDEGGIGHGQQSLTVEDDHGGVTQELARDRRTATGLVMAQNIEAARAKAEAAFKRSDEHLGPGPRAKQLSAEALAVQEKTARLRALRLTKEGAGLAARATETSHD